MRRFALAALICGAALTLVPAGTADAQQRWTIESFASDITVREDGTVRVLERIRVDFGSSERHGIFRDLPLTYRTADGGTHYTRIDNIAVTQDTQPAQMHTTSSGANMRIRIGDPNSTISGEHTYSISYTTTGVIGSFAEFDELNWNVTGTDWDAPIEAAKVTVHLPADVLQAACYAGPEGARTTCSELTESERSVVARTENLAPQEGLTVAVGFTPGAVSIPTVSREAGGAYAEGERIVVSSSHRRPSISPIEALAGPGGLLSGALVLFVGLLAIARHFWRYGRDRYWQRAHLPGIQSDRDGKTLPERILPFGHGAPTVVEYDPPDGLRPAEIGVLLDERADTLDVSATIVDLASRGYLEITEIPKSWFFGSTDYEFMRTDKPEDDLLTYEQLLLTRLFEDDASVKMSDLKEQFYKDLADVKDALYREVTAKGLFPGRPDKTRKRYFAIGGGMVAAGVLLFFALLKSLDGAVALVWYQPILAGVAAATLLLALAVFVVAPWMPRKSAYGRELYQRALGYELFVSGTEKYRARFYENESLFFAVLPYAIMFGVTDKLAEAFKDMGIEPPQPSFYHGSGSFNPAIVAASMQSFSSSVSSAMASAPSSSGSGGGSGGFSGGGFSGGGGGAW